eukprot:m.53298 g.53298  ORF g.53298 m.53298 type:complete len:298 (-) comp13149_c0_seq2:424-1317(-)
MSALLSKATQAIILKVESLSSPLTDSSFQETGKLTVEEFVRAGDFLVQNFPSWSWGSGSTIRPDLPADKQFLQAKNVPSRERPSVALDEMQVEDDDDGGWMKTNPAEEEEAICDLGTGMQAVSLGGQTAEEDDDEDMGDIEDLDSFDYKAHEDDVVVATATAADSTGVEATRTYDITITYDKFYSTPRVWLFGYDKNHNPLKGSAWRSDFSAEHVDRTVTHEQHPHLGYSCPSIHPCKHADAMKRMIAMVASGNKGKLDVSCYMVIFLKFIQSMIPNIEYDYTADYIIQQEGISGGS